MHERVERSRPLQHIQARQFGGVLRFIIRQPLFVFRGAGRFHLGERHAALVHLRQVERQFLARQVQVGAGHLDAFANLGFGVWPWFTGGVPSVWITGFPLFQVGATYFFTKNVGVRVAFGVSKATPGRSARRSIRRR